MAKCPKEKEPARFPNWTSNSKSRQLEGKHKHSSILALGGRWFLGHQVPEINFPRILGIVSPFFSNIVLFKHGSVSLGFLVVVWKDADPWKA